MKRQFINYTSIHTSEREYKKKFGINNNIKPISIFNKVILKNKEKNWRVFNQKIGYFSFVPLLISNKTSRNYYEPTKCCVDYQILKKKDKKLYNI